MKRNKNIILGFLVVVILAGFFRLYLIPELPGGLFPDEAANGLDVNQILEGKPQAFYERGNGREALFFYLLTPAVAVFGRTPFAHHLTSALLGFLTVMLTYILAFRWFNPRVAFFSSFVAAVNAWHVVLSRTAFRAISAPVFALLFFIFATRVVQSKDRFDYWLSSVLAGISLSLGFYTYISFRMMVPIVGVLFLALVIYDLRREDKFKLIKKYWKAVTAGLTAGALTILPLIWFFTTNPFWLAGRSGQVSIFNPELNQGDLIGTFFSIVVDTFLAFFTIGDANWRHNIASQPFLSNITSILFFLGLILSLGVSMKLLYKFWQNKKLNLSKQLPVFIVLLSFIFMLVPEILTAEGIPHGLRLIGVIPWVFIFAGLAVDWLVKKGKTVAGTQTIKEIAGIAIAIILIFELIYGYHLYFVQAKNSPEYYKAFRSDLTVVSAYLNQRNNKAQTYLVIDFFSEQTPQYMTTKTDQPYHVIDPATLWRGPEKVRIDRYEKERFGLSLNQGDQIIFTQSTIFDTKAFAQHFPEAGLVLEHKNQWGQTIMKIYEY